MEELKARTKDGIDPIQNLDNLCDALGISREELDTALSLTDEDRYVEIKLRKKNGSTRIVYNPHPKLRRIQRRIKNRILSSQIIYPHYLYGSLSDKENPRDYIRCAAVHCGAKTVLKVDIRNFFDNISRDLVFEVFKTILHYPPEVSDTLANLCTRCGVVPQGASTSSFIANLCLLDEHDLVRKLSYDSLRYTRLIDDITISSKTPNKDLEKWMRVLKRMIEDSDFELNEEKSGIEHVALKAFSVHGLRINRSTPSLTREEVRKIRSDVHNLKNKASEPNARVSFEYRRLFESVSGKVNKLKRVNHPRYNILRKQMRDILPLPSKKDIKRCQIMLATLVRDHANHNSSYLYKVRHARLRHRLGILRRIYHHEAAAMRQTLRGLEPNFSDDT